MSQNGQYLIKSVEHNEYLFAAANTYQYDGDRRRCFTWKQKTSGQEGYWDIQLIRAGPSASENYYTIRNTFYGEYLYADGDNFKYDASRRKVFTWKKLPHTNVEADQKCHWIIQCK